VCPGRMGLARERGHIEITRVLAVHQSLGPAEVDVDRDRLAHAVDYPAVRLLQRALIGAERARREPGASDQERGKQADAARDQAPVYGSRACAPRASVPTYASTSCPLRTIETAAIVKYQAPALP
jgi:hypothetical protein